MSSSNHLLLDFAFKGSWLVNYDPKEFNYPDILVILAQISDFFKKTGIDFNSININFNKNGNKNYFFKVKDVVLLSFCGLDKEFAVKSTKPCDPAVLKPLPKPIKTIFLLFPRLENDPRWKTMGLPSGQLFLASNLQASGFEATPLPLVLPAGNLPPGALLADMVGFTIFEDLLPTLRPFLASFKAVYSGCLAAGGPFPTLAPLAALYHLPQVNLFVRGEAELALPEILNALNHGDIEALFSQLGVFWQQPGLIVMSNFDRVNRPENFSRFQFNFDFLQVQHLEHGLEMNFSRGCKRGCVFCCRVQGTKFRQLPLEKAEELLKKYGEKIAEFSLHGDPVYGVNINDDDILQDPAYAAAVFALVKKYGFRIIGIQTSPVSLVLNSERVNFEVLDLVADPELYIDGRPLLWLGTDVFLLQRARRLGKRLPSPAAFASLLAELEKRGLRHFHYWISSDGDSTWQEFIEELALIINYDRNFPNFGLLAHAPFIVPYPASRSFQFLPANAPNLRIKKELRAPDPPFNYVLPERLETSFPNLNRLLNNEKAGGETGFFDLLKEKEFIAAAQLTYHFLKQEQLQAVDINRDVLMRASEKLAELIESII